MKKMKLAALTDFPDDSLYTVFTPEKMDEMMAVFKEHGVTRMYNQYYGNSLKYGWCMNCDAFNRQKNRETGLSMPDWCRVFAESAHKHGMETAAVMRPQENGVWIAYTPYMQEGKEFPGVDHLGGRMLVTSPFLNEHPELRIKRRSWDLDPDAVNKTICSIKLYKQNNAPTRIRKEHIKIYTAPQNSWYKPYTDDFTVTISEEAARDTVRVIKGGQDYPTELLTLKGAPIQVITISGLHIDDQFVAVGVTCGCGCETEYEYFKNTPVNGIACFDADGNQICATPGGNITRYYMTVPNLECGFYFDDGFGAQRTLTLDPAEGEGYFCIAKGKNQYCHAALCECEPAVQEYWLQMLEEAMDDGYDIIGNRIENHAVHVDEPYAYGYNDCIKQEYFKRYGECTEQDMDLSKIAKIRGDVYTALFVEAARRIRARGKKVYVTLNIEMLHDPIPLDRRMAYPMNVEWQWERWLEEIKPDEINFRMYCNSIDFFLSDPQCIHMLEVAKSYNVPMTVERYTYNDWVDEYDRLKALDIFDSMTLYETCNLINGGDNGVLKLTDKGKQILPEMKKRILKENDTEA